MSEPELWVKKAGDTGDATMLITGAIDSPSFKLDDMISHGALVLVRVPFDEVAQTVADYYAPFIPHRTNLLEMAKEAISNAVRNTALGEGR